MARINSSISKEKSFCTKIKKKRKKESVKSNKVDNKDSEELLSYLVPPLIPLIPSTSTIGHTESQITESKKWWEKAKALTVSPKESFIS